MRAITAEIEEITSRFDGVYEEVLADARLTVPAATGQR
jgi:hypothetical protein